MLHYFQVFLYNKYIFTHILSKWSSLFITSHRHWFPTLKVISNICFGTICFRYFKNDFQFPNFFFVLHKFGCLWLTYLSHYDKIPLQYWIKLYSFWLICYPGNVEASRFGRCLWGQPLLPWKSFSGVFKRGLVLFSLSNFSKIFIFSYFIILSCCS